MTILTIILNNNSQKPTKKDVTPAKRFNKGIWISPSLPRIARKRGNKNIYFKKKNAENMFKSFTCADLCVQQSTHSQFTFSRSLSLSSKRAIAFQFQPKPKHRALHTRTIDCVFACGYRVWQRARGGGTNEQEYWLNAVLTTWKCSCSVCEWVWRFSVDAVNNMDELDAFCEHCVNSTGSGFRPGRRVSTSTANPKTTP